MPKVSIVLPIHDMKNGAFFLWRAINSIMEQTFKNYEIIITKEGSMPVNTNIGIKRATGELIKILYMDDWFAHPLALEHMVEAMNQRPKSHWLITATDTNTNPHWTDDLETGNNKLGSPSALMTRNPTTYFDEKLSWLLDCDLYKRLESQFGKPVILEDININIGVHEGQMTNILTDEEKLTEHNYTKTKFYE